MSDDFPELLRSLNRLFWILTFAALAFLALGFLLQRMNITISPSVGNPRVWGILLLTLSALLGVALPILMRTMFNRRAVSSRRVEMPEFVTHQKRLIVVAVSAAYVAGIAYLLALAGLYLYGPVLCGLYGIYSAIPQERKLKGEMRYYGLGGK
ncbi:MAG: hypothetical protein JXB06_01305 [Spirochaetales bacterium]|nr:hypothetical protein [Spirochaetales bacterium]